MCAGLLAAAILGLLPAGLAAEQRGKPVRREILALYDGRHEPSAQRSRIHRYAETPLNHLGYVLVYRDANAYRPAPSELAGVAAVLTWFTAPLADPSGYLAWAARVTGAGRRLVVLGDVGAGAGSEHLPAINRLMGHLGLAFSGRHVTSPAGVRTVHVRPDLVGHECSLDPVAPPFAVAKAWGDHVRAALVLTAPQSGGEQHGVVVATSNGGGYAARGYELCHENGPLEPARWLIDPLRFFNEALGLPRFPVPDVTTLSGRRILIATAAGSGPTPAGPTDRAGGRARVATGEDAAVTFVPAHPDLPVSIAPEPAAGVVAMLAPSTTRLDPRHPSLTFVAPMSEPRAGARVLKGAMASEAAFESLALAGGPGYRTLATTIARTESPVRLRPIHLHLDAAARRREPAADHAAAIISDIRPATIIPVPAQRYAAILEGAFSALIVQQGPMAWRIEDRGALETVRFDDGSDLEVDLDASRGVIGQHWHQGALYVALDQAVDEARIVLAGRYGPTADARQSRLSLVESRWSFSRLEHTPAGLRAAAQGYGAGEMTWQNAAPGLYEAVLDGPDGRIWRGRAEAGEDGMLRLVLPALRGERAKVSIARLGASAGDTP